VKGNLPTLSRMGQHGVSARSWGAWSPPLEIYQAIATLVLQCRQARLITILCMYLGTRLWAKNSGEGVWASVQACRWRSGWGLW
jgi:hypothetical protein